MRTVQQVPVGFVLLVAICAPVEAKEFHAATQGLANGDGSQAAPWDLTTALSKVDIIRAGDTLWLHEGVYRGGFECRLAGNVDAPVTIRRFPGERVTIDSRPRDKQDTGLFAVMGDHAVFWGFEVTCSDPKRETSEGGSWPGDIRRGGMFCRASHVKFINLVVHDTAGGFGFWSEGEGGEIYGSLIYHNGWRGPDRGHGHGIYAQNRTLSKRLIDNIVFRQFGSGIHCYGSNQAFVQGFEIEGNIGFHNGILAGPNAGTPAIFVGGGRSIERLRVADNYTFEGAIHCGYPWGNANRDLLLRDNYVVGGLFVRDFKTVEVTGNTVIGPSGLVRLESSTEFDPAQYVWDKNDYFRTTDMWSAFEIAGGEKRRGMEFSGWQAAGFDAEGRFGRQAAGTHVFVRPNRYEQGRAHVAVYNWDRADAVDVDLQGVLQGGDRYRLVSAQDFFGTPLFEGVYDGRPLRLAMRSNHSAAPVGMPDFQPPATEPVFGAYVVLSDAAR
ncbi:MAG TPA: right-handed parallel beta-helix repeat-containing protein [Pirellulales bacterium]|nr:right-handed parallel beta-helix repeat-containing protein [Pirellulales bacterium]